VCVGRSGLRDGETGDEGLFAGCGVGARGVGGGDEVAGVTERVGDESFELGVHGEGDGSGGVAAEDGAVGRLGEGARGLDELGDGLALPGGELVLEALEAGEGGPEALVDEGGHGGEVVVVGPAGALHALVGEVEAAGVEVEFAGDGFDLAEELAAFLLGGGGGRHGGVGGEGGGDGEGRQQGGAEGEVAEVHDGISFVI